MQNGSKLSYANLTDVFRGKEALELQQDALNAVRRGPTWERHVAVQITSIGNN